MWNIFATHKAHKLKFYLSFNDYNDREEFISLGRLGLILTMAFPRSMKIIDIRWVHMAVLVGGNFDDDFSNK